MYARELFNKLFAFGGKSEMPPPAVDLGGFAGNQFSFDQTIDNVDGGMVFYLEPLAQLRDRQASGGRKSFDGEQGFILLGIHIAVGPKKIFAEAEKLAEQVPELGEGVVIVGI